MSRDVIVPPGHPIDSCVSCWFPPNQSLRCLQCQFLPLHTQSAKDAMMNMREEVNMQQNNYQAHVEAARVAELEAAQAAAQAALMVEMDLLRRQKHGAEQHARDLEEQVSLEFAQDRYLYSIENNCLTVPVAFVPMPCCTRNRLRLCRLTRKTCSEV